MCGVPSRHNTASESPTLAIMSASPNTVATVQLHAHISHSAVSKRVILKKTAMANVIVRRSSSFNERLRQDFVIKVAKQLGEKLAKVRIGCDLSNTHHQ
jgi:hypothetical protein